MSEALEYIYELTANRIKQKIQEGGISYGNIYLSDPKILSCIVNNKRKKKNIFLVPDRVFFDYKNGDGLIPRLFHPEECGKSLVSDSKLRAYKCEILWGKKDERLEYSKELFIKIMRDLYGSKENREGKKYENIFCAYVPFAKDYTYQQITASNPGVPLINYGILVIRPPKQHLRGAAEFLYREVKTQYESALLDFTNGVDTFKNIERDFRDAFVQGRLVPILKEYIEQEHPLGLRVRELIQGELSLVPTILDGTMDERHKRYYRALNRATSSYFVELEKIQAEKHR